MLAAFLSDSAPIYGRRRGPYLGIGLLLQLLAYATLAASAAPSVGVLGSLDFAQACGMVLVGTMSDTLIVESMKRDDAGKASFGNLQAHCWIALFVGSLIGNAASGHAHEGLGTSGVFQLTAVFKVFMLCLPLAIRDLSGQKMACSTRDGCSIMAREVVTGANDPRIWRPVLFLFLYAASTPLCLCRAP